MKMSSSESKLSSSKQFQSWYLPEPLLIFGDGKTHVDPKLGLTIYGPLKTTNSQHSSPMSIGVGVIGTGETISLANRYVDRLMQNIPSENKDPFQNASFPGFKNVFDCELIKSENLNEIIPTNEINNALKEPLFDKRVSNAVQLFLQRIESISEKVPKPDVAICALPQGIIDFCVVRKTASGSIKKKKTKQEKELIKTLKGHKKHHQQYLDDFEDIADKILEDEISTSNFWRMLKAGSMKYGMPTQIAWPSTLIPKNELKNKLQRRQEDSSAAWNFSVAMYYKGSGFPWTMTRMEKGTCYVGISFFKDLTDVDNKMRTSMAQIFTYTGEGLVLRGDRFEWDTENDRTPHLNEDSSKELLKKVISLYTKRMNQPPSRVVVHKSSRYWPDEKKGFEIALEGIPYHDLITIGRRGIRFFRYGQYPPLRGTVIKTGDKNYVLYTRGYIPFLRTYPGPHVPIPLEILEHHGDSPAEKVLAEILALSKMNWNSAEYGLAQPITLLFSKRVGDVMATLPEDSIPRHEYLFYM